MQHFCISTLLYLFATVAMLLKPTCATVNGGLIPAFMQPFHIFSDPSHRNLYSIRLDLHLYRDARLRNFHVRVINRPPTRERELEFELRYDKTLRNLLHLGASKDDERGIAAAYPLASFGLNPSHRTFALLTIHPPDEGEQLRDNFPSIVVRGYARVRDFDHNDIEAALRLLQAPRGAQVAAGQVFSIKKLFREIQGHDPLPI